MTPTNKIDDELSTELLAFLVEACGFSLSFDHAPGADEWTLSKTLPAGQGSFDVEYVGTRRSVCAFLIGYGAMRLETTQILNEVEGAQRDLILSMRVRLGQPPEGSP